MVGEEPVFEPALLLLLAGKLHAILQCSYTKDRDSYDLLWYLSDPAWSRPNFILVNDALAQTGWQSETLTSADWRGELRECLRSLDWQNIQAGVRPFVEPGFDMSLIEPGKPGICIGEMKIPAVLSNQPGRQTGIVMG